MLTGFPKSFPLAGIQTPRRYNKYVGYMLASMIIRWCRLGTFEMRYLHSPCLFYNTHEDPMILFDLTLKYLCPSIINYSVLSRILPPLRKFPYSLSSEPLNLRSHLQICNSRTLVPIDDSLNKIAIDVICRPLPTHCRRHWNTTPTQYYSITLVYLT